MKHTLVTVVFSFLLLTNSELWAQNTVNLDLERVRLATVLIIQARTSGNDLTITCVGSGTIVSQTGLILTNTHNTITSDTCPGNTLVIAFSVREGEAPTAQFRAEFAQTDEGLDLAILKVTQYLDGRLISPGELTLPFVELGSSSSLQLDQTITMAGFAGIGAEPVTYVRGTISGFILEPSLASGPTWIKTSTVLSGTMSGGGGYNQQGELIGVPITTPLRRGLPGTTCLPVQDTNRDGVVNSNDDCVAVGGSINALRPVDLIRPLLRAALLGLRVEFLDVNAAQESIMPGAPTFRRIFFSPSVNEAGMPTSVISRLPAGSNSLYLFFDYENMTPQTVYELRVTTDGDPNPVFSLGPVSWSGGTDGLWFIGSSGQTWPNGVYEFTLFADGVAFPTAKLIVGGTPLSEPIFADVIFGLLDARGNPLGNGFVLPTGNTASARFVFRNMQPGLTWTSIWYLDGSERVRTPNIWDGNSEGTTTTSIEAPEGLPAGSYRLELYIEDRLAATSDFTIAGAFDGVVPRIFSNVSFVPQPDAPLTTSTQDSIANYPGGIAQIFVVFDWQQIARGTQWAIRWTVDREPFLLARRSWREDLAGERFTQLLTASNGIPDGTYSVGLYLGNVLLAEARVRIGIGQLPIESSAQIAGAQLQGYVLDLETGSGIVGATVILIGPEYSVSEFDWNQDKVYSTAITDRNGKFVLEKPLEISTAGKTVAYSAIITAEGYLPVSADGLAVTPENANSLQLTVYLTRD